DITITNAICFAPDRICAYYTDTVTQKIMRQPLNAGDGWPVGAPEVFIDLSAKGLNPDGAVTDADGTLWVAIWGSSCVIAFGRDGTEQRRLDVPARQPTCPAFGGDDLRDLYVTSANEGLPEDAVNGATYLFADMAQGLSEPKVIL
ncbi:MAG: SMP-30/gluconolactonase/LRE family protein, partial [Sulfitobacter geojensis]